MDEPIPQEPLPTEAPQREAPAEEAPPQEAPPRKIARWRYVVPNAITCFGLLIGLTAIFRAMEGQYLESGWLIMLCVLIDKLDGTAARLLKATSAIGVQLDSFADFVTFGIAPGTLVYMALSRGPEADRAFGIWATPTMSWVLKVLVAAYILSACIRLARFNVLTEEAVGKPGVMYGMPTTFAGAFVSVMWVLVEEYQVHELARWAPLIMAGLGAMMLSSLAIPKVGTGMGKPLLVLTAINIPIIYAFGILRLYPEYLAGVLVVYGVGGFGWGFIHRAQLSPKTLDPYPP